MLLLACHSPEPAPIEAVDSHPQDTAEPARIGPLGDEELWARPIADWTEQADDATGGDFWADIWDLEVFEDRLYLGYGDANANLGPTELRHFVEDDPDSLTSAFTVDEEAVHQYRTIGDTLVVPGVDSTGGHDLGSVYFGRGDEWTGSRTLANGIHVLDVAPLDDAVIAAGAGYRADGTYGPIFWRGGEAGFEVFDEPDNPYGDGYGRALALLPLDEALYALGYWVGDDGSYSGAGWRVGADGLEAWSAPSWLFYPDVAEVLDADRAVVGGQKLWYLRRCEIWWIDGDGQASAVTELDDHCLLDAQALGDGHALLLSATQDSWTASSAPYDTRLDLWDGSELTTVWTSSGQLWPTSVAWWRDAVYLGTWSGTIWRIE